MAKTKCTACGKSCWTQPCSNCRELAARKVRRAAPAKGPTPGDVRRAHQQAQARADREVEQEQLVTERKLRFITELTRNGGHVERACQAAGVSRVMMGNYRDDDAEFALAWEAVQEANVERLETEADRRALGYEEPVFYKGEPTGHQLMRYSDNLLMFRLKALKPQVYRDGPGNKPGEQLSEEELDAALTKMVARRRARTKPDEEAELTM